MQKSNFTSLFFFVNLIIYFISTVALVGQEEVDSTLYHYKAIIKPQTNKSVTQAVNYFKRQSENAGDNPTYNASTYEFIAMGQLYVGDLYESEKSSIQVLEALDKLPQTDETREARIRIANNLGRIFKAIGNPSLALTYYKRILPTVSTRSHRIVISNNIASVYIENGAYQKAIEILAPFVADTSKLEYNDQLSTILDNYGYSLSKLGDASGIDFLLEALVINEKSENTRGRFSINRHLAQYHQDYKNSTKAKQYAATALQIAYDLNLPDYKQEALGLAIEVGNTQDARLFKKLSDSLQKVRQQAGNKYAAQTYSYEKFQTQAIESKLIAQQEKEDRLKYQFIGIIIMCCAIAIVIILSIRYKKRRLEQVYLTETRISKRIHDEVANDVYRLISQLQTNTHNTSHLLDHLEGIYTKTRDISRENSDIDTDGAFHNALQDLLLGYRTPSLNIITKGIDTIPWNTTSKVHKTTIYRVLQELMTNTKKHSKASIAFVSFSRKDKKIHIQFNDNGIGGDLNSKNGLQNVETRIVALKGTITFDSEVNKGFKAHIQI